MKLPAIVYFLKIIFGKGPSIKYVQKIFRKTNFFSLLIRTRTCAYQGVDMLVFRKTLLYVWVYQTNYLPDQNRQLFLNLITITLNKLICKNDNIWIIEGFCLRVANKYLDTYITISRMKKFNKIANMLPAVKPKLYRSHVEWDMNVKDWYNVLKMLLKSTNLCVDIFHFLVFEILLDHKFQ